MKLPKVYASDKSLESDSIDMTLSINPLGCSQKVLDELQKINMSDISKYPNDRKIRKSISEKFNVTEENVLMGAGSEQLIKLIAQTFVEKGGSVLVQTGSFPLFTKESKLVGGKVQYFDPRDFKTNTNPKLIFISNPSTPTGEVFEGEIIEKILNNFPKSIVVVDEANGEFNSETSINSVLRNENLIVLRTFSKVYGLAGLRIGFAVGKGKMFTKLIKAQQPFAVSSVGCRLAEIALSDADFVNRTIIFFNTERLFVYKNLRDLGLDVSNSITNNLFISGKNIKILMKKSKEMGVGVIDNSYFPNLQAKGFRISLRDKKTNRKFIKIIKEIQYKRDISLIGT